MSSRKLAPLLWGLLTLFIARVAGQVVVFFYSPAFLPPMGAWYSGLLPYRWLLPSQILIVLLYFKICFDFQQGFGFWAVPKRRLGLFLTTFGVIYLMGMIVRCALAGLSIPVFFHWVLAVFLIIVGAFHLRIFTRNP